MTSNKRIQINFRNGDDKQMTREEIKSLLETTKKEYNNIEKQYNKELRKEQKAILREKLIRLDERIQVYKEILK